MDLVQLEENREAFTQMFQGGLQRLLQGDVEGWIDMWTEDGSMEFPYRPDDYVPRLDGKPAIREYLKDYPSHLRLDRVTHLTVHQTLDPNVVIVEFGVEGIAVATGRSYNQTYVGVVTLRDGRIAHYRDYWNPLVAMVALGGPEALQAFGTVNA